MSETTLFHAIKHMFDMEVSFFLLTSSPSVIRQKDKLEAFQVLLRHILAVKYRTKKHKMQKENL